MNFVIYVIGFLLEHLKYLILYKIIFKIPLKNKKLSYLILPSASVMMSYIYFETNYGIRCVVYLLLLILQGYIFLEEKISKTFILSLWSFCIINCLTGVVEECVLIFTQIFSIKIYEGSFINIVSQILSVIVLFVMNCTLDKKFNYKKMTVKSYLLYLVILAFNSFALTILEQITENEDDIIKIIAIQVIYVVITIFVFVQLMLIMYLAVMRDAYKEKDALKKIYLKAEEEHYLYLEKRELETKKFRHDIKSHIDILLKMCDEGNITQVQKYLQSMNQRTNKFSNRVSVNCNIVDAIINQCAEQCKNDGVELEVLGHFPFTCLVDPFDICTVVSNMIKNAQTAVLKCKKKWIKYTVKYDEMTQEILIKMQNTYEGKVDFSSTTKDDKCNHGYGLINIKETVERYNGNFNIVEKDGIVETNVSIKNISLE